MFDPRSVKIVDAPKRLPAIPADRLHIHSMRKRFAAPPLWQPEALTESNLNRSPVVPAAVLLAVVPKAVPTLLLTIRSPHLLVHAGQIAFPGGKLSNKDAHLIDAALREAQEEIGLQRSDVEVLGVLPSFPTGTGFAVTPVVGIVSPYATLKPNPDEVEQIFEVPLAFVLDPANHLLQQLDFQGSMRQWYAMPYELNGKEFYIWGITAGILRNFYHFLVA